MALSGCQSPDRRGFETVTGLKRDSWLVRTVGLLAAAMLGVI
jgi:hypothetical protein